MKCYLIAILLITALFPDESLAGRGRGFFKFGKSKPKSRSPSPTSNPANRQPLNTEVTAYNPQTSRFSPGISASSSSSSLHSGSSHRGQVHSQSSSSGYASGHPSLHDSHQSLPPRSRSPSPSSSNPFLRLSGSERVKSNVHTDKGPKNTFKKIQSKHPASIHRPSSPSRLSSPIPLNVGRSRSPKRPLNQLRDQTPEKSTSLSTSPERWPSPANSESKASKTKLDLPIIDDFAKRIEEIDKEAGVSLKDTKRKQKSVRKIKKVLKADDQQMQKQKSEDSGSVRSRSLERISRSADENRRCSNEKSAAFECFDYYEFSLYWPPTVAYAQKSMALNSNKDKVIDDWVIHGLWPSTKGQNKDRPDNKCRVTSTKFDVRSLKKIVHDLEKVWFTLVLESNNVFWEHEFNEHGSCAIRSVYINDVLGYFKFGMNLRKNINLKGVLELGGFKPGTTMKYRDIYDVISSRIAKPHIEITTDSKNGKTYLNEIKICHNHQFRPIDCATDKATHLDIWKRDISYLSKDEI